MVPTGFEPVFPVRINVKNGFFSGFAPMSVTIRPKGAEWHSNPVIISESKYRNMCVFVYLCLDGGIIFNQWIP